MTVLVSTAVIGPKAQGRNYGLRRHAGPRLTSESQARLADFALSLAGWAMQRRQRFVAMLPLAADGSSFAVARVRHLGEGELGPIAVAHLLLVDATLLDAIDWASPRLLRLLPQPEDPAFGLEPLKVSPRSLKPAAARPMTAPRVGWSDVAIDVGDEDPEGALAALVEGVEAPARRATLTGWASTSLMTPVGDLDPARVFKLITHASTESPAAFQATHELLSIKAMAEPTLAWKAWLQLAAIAEREPAAAALRSAQWSQEKARLPAADVMFEEIASACAELTPEAMIALLRAVIRHASGADAASQALRDGVSETFDALVAVADAQGAAFYVRGLADGAGSKALPSLDEVIARPAVAAWLGDVARGLDLTGVVTRWAARLAAAPAFADEIALAAPTFLDAVLDTALTGLDDEGARRLAGTLLRLQCQRPSVDGERIRAALSALLARPPASADAALADPAVLTVAKRFAPDLSATLATRAIPTGLRQARHPDEFTRAAWALVTVARASR
ncbi:hypothetical protein [Caulobacter sp.]|uniref:hypothetical protein n=1 Tax=Caulobacter sp. TaxID=78 RepID=UPI001B11EA3C|nr:hypothetical protein [Caulobacter sp.]MBO9546326.1 hypothetical protein [Caulobacter sp.]